MKKENQHPYRVVLIGAGRIASSFDTPKSKLILSHAHALTSHENFTLIGMTDIDKNKGEKEARKWGVPFFEVLDDLLVLRPDVVVIATPDETHTALLLKVLSINPKLIICEKPVGSTSIELATLKEKILPRKTPILVNFSRRFDPTVRAIQSALKNGEYGKVISASGIYTNGILHNGAHLFDLARFLFGEVKSVSGLFATNDRSKVEPSVGGFATFARCPQFSIMCGDERNYAVFEFEIMTERKRIRFTNFGLALISEEVVADPIFKGFRALSKPKTTATGLAHAMEHLYNHAFLFLEGREAPISSLREAIRTQEACISLLESFSHHE